ncbi:hypothetical protein ACSSS7_008029 [Eimeria intestinalis]
MFELGRLGEQLVANSAKAAHKTSSLEIRGRHVRLKSSISSNSSSKRQQQQQQQQQQRQQGGSLLKQTKS